jgi:hypothetical protein
MRKIMVLAVSVCALAGLGVASSVASANNGATTTHFTANYTDPTFGPAVCSGERIVKTAPKAFVKDSETCLLTTGYTAGVYTIGWNSDLDGKPAVSVTETITDNGDGTSTENIVANY